MRGGNATLPPARGCLRGRDAFVPLWSSRSRAALEREVAELEAQVGQLQQAHQQAEARLAQRKARLKECDADIAGAPGEALGRAGVGSGTAGVREGEGHLWACPGRVPPTPCVWLWVALVRWCAGHEKALGKLRRQLQDLEAEARKADSR